MSASERELLTALLGSGLDQRCTVQAAVGVMQLAAEFKVRWKYRIYGPVRRAARKQLDRTLRELTVAARNVEDGNPSRREARKLIRFAGCCKDFGKLSDRAEHFAASHERDRHRIDELEQRKSECRIRIDELHSLREIRTPEHLKAVGKALRNCLAGDSGLRYQEELVAGETQFWAVLRGSDTVGVLSIDTENWDLVQSGGATNEYLDLPPETWAKIEHELGIEDEHDTEFDVIIASTGGPPRLGTRSYIVVVKSPWERFKERFGFVRIWCALLNLHMRLQERFPRKSRL